MWNDATIQINRENLCFVLYVRTVSEAIRSLVKERNGDQRQWALNTTKNDTTRKFPFLINFGRKALVSSGDYDRIATTRLREEMSETEIVASEMSETEMTWWKTIKSKEGKEKLTLLNFLTRLYKSKFPFYFNISLQENNDKTNLWSIFSQSFGKRTEN